MRSVVRGLHTVLEACEKVVNDLRLASGFSGFFGFLHSCLWSPKPFAIFRDISSTNASLENILRIYKYRILAVSLIEGPSHFWNDLL